MLYPKIISFSGKSGAGKDTLTNEILLRYDYTHLKFADGLKDLTSIIINKSRDEIEVLKDTEYKISLSESDLNTISEYVDIHLSVLSQFLNKEFNSIRHFLQFIGTDIIRKYNPNWHINNLKSKINSESYYIISDCRFKNELSCIKEMGKDSMCFYIKRRTGGNEVPEHISEKDLSELDFTLWEIIENNASKNVLFESIMGYIDKSRKKHYPSKQEFLDSKKALK